MSKYVIENVDPLAPKSVCIYVVSPDGTLVPKDITQFTNLDAFGKGLGVNLLRGYKVSCVGAYPFAGAVDVLVREGGINSPVTVVNSTDKVSTYNTTEELVNGLTNEWDIKTTQIKPFRTVSEANDRIFMLNSRDTNTDILAVANEHSNFENIGPEGAVAVTLEGKQINICLAPAVTIPLSPVSDPVLPGLGLEEGEWVVEVDGKVVPHYFTTEQLPVFFNEENLSGYGISFAESKILIDEPTVPEIGTTTQLTYHYKGPAGPRTTVWESTNETVATVTNEGLLTIVGPGATTIKLTVNGALHDQIDLEVAEPPVKGTTFTFDLQFAEGNFGNILNNGTETITLVWPDGTNEELVSKATTVPNGKYAGQGDLQCTIVHKERANLKLTHESIVSIDSWSDIGYVALELSSKRLTSVPDTAPPLLTNYNKLFSGAEILNDPKISNWDTSIATTMIMTFHNAYSFNQPLNWDVANVTAFNVMFTSTISPTIAFAQDLTHWRVKKITTRPNGWDSSSYSKIGEPYWGIDPAEVTNGMVIYTQQTSTALVTVKSDAVLTVDWGDGNVSICDPAVNNGMVGNNYPQVQGSYVKVYQVTITSDDPETAQKSMAVNGAIMKVRKWMDKPFTSIKFSDDSTYQTSLSSVPDHAPPGVVSVKEMFRQNKLFNDPNVTLWDYSGVEDMDGFLWDATKFTQNLSKICVSKILTEPSNFNTGGKLTPAQKPVWGTCPVKS